MSNLKNGHVALLNVGVFTKLREWPLITGGGGGGLQHGRGCQSEVLPPRKGGAQKRGGHNNFLGSFNTGAQSFGHNDWGAQKVSTLDGRGARKVLHIPGTL